MPISPGICKMCWDSLMLPHLGVSCEINFILSALVLHSLFWGLIYFGALLPFFPPPPPRLSRLQGSPWEASKSTQLKKCPHQFRIKHVNDIATFLYHQVLSTLPCTVPRESAVLQDGPELTLSLQGPVAFRWIHSSEILWCRKCS